MNMKIEIDNFNGEFEIKNGDLSKVKPFSHADVIVNCDQPLSNIRGGLEHRVEKYLSDLLAPSRIKVFWDKSTEWYQEQNREEKEFPRISKLGMGVNFDF